MIAMPKQKPKLRVIEGGGEKKPKPDPRDHEHRTETGGIELDVMGYLRDWLDEEMAKVDAGDDEDKGA